MKAAVSVFLALLSHEGIFWDSEQLAQTKYDHSVNLERASLYRRRFGTYYCMDIYGCGVINTPFG